VDESVEKISWERPHTSGRSVRYIGMNNNNPKGNDMKTEKFHVVALTKQEVYFLTMALGAQTIKDIQEQDDPETDEYRREALAERSGVAVRLARVFGAINDQITAEYEESVVRESVTNLEKEIEDLLK